MTVDDLASRRIVDGHRPPLQWEIGVSIRFATASAKEEWMRPQEDAAKPPLIGADGVVAHKQLHV